MTKIYVWDPIVRIFHWSLVATIAAAFIIEGEEGVLWHQYAGYAAMALVGIRILWGFVGGKYARFIDFFPTPSRLKAYLTGKYEHYQGHNPLAAIMVFVLLGLVLATGYTGYQITLYGEVEYLEELHEVLANTLLGMIGLHVAAALIMSWWKKNYIKTMITGYREPRNFWVD